MQVHEISQVAFELFVQDSSTMLSDTILGQTLVGEVNLASIALRIRRLSSEVSDEGILERLSLLSEPG